MNEEYEIVIQGHLDQAWEVLFDGFSLTHNEDGTTLLRGIVVDQPSLHGFLSRISEMGWTLLKVEQIK